MDVVLGVAVTGPVARLALVGPGARGADVIDQSVVDLGDSPIQKLTETVIGTNRLLAGENHRLVGTRLCWTDDPQAAQLRQALEDSGVSNVAVLSESQAVTALMRAAGRPGAALVMDNETATLSVVGSATGDEDTPPTVLAKEPIAGADATAMFDTMMAKLNARPDAPGEVYLVGASPDLTRVADQLRDASTMRVEVADDPTFALARGAAMAAAPPAAGLTGDATAMAPGVRLTGDETAMAPAAGLTGDETAMAQAAGLTGDETTVVPPPNAEEPQLAYSMAGDSELLPAEMDEYGPEFDEYDDFDETQAIPARLSRRSLLIGNAVVAFAVIGFASLAVAVAVAIRPTASQQPVVGHQNAAPGKFMPLLPTQQQAPVPPPPVDQPNAGFQGGTVPDVNGYLPAQGTSPGGGGVPAVPIPAAPGPGTPGFVPNPNVPIPVPIFIPYPGWQPPYPGQITTTPTTTTPTTTTTTTTTTPTTTTSPTTTTPTTTTPTTTTQPHVTTTPPTSSETPYTSTQTPTTAAPPHIQTQQPVTPQQPHSGGGHHGF